MKKIIMMMTVSIIAGQLIAQTTKKLMPPPPPLVDIPKAPPAPAPPMEVMDIPIPPSPPTPPEHVKFTTPIIVNDRGYTITVHSTTEGEIILLRKKGVIQKIRMSIWNAKPEYFENKYGKLPPPPPAPPTRPMSAKAPKSDNENIIFTPPVIVKDK